METGKVLRCRFLVARTRTDSSHSHSRGVSRDALAPTAHLTPMPRPGAATSIVACAALFMPRLNRGDLTRSRVAFYAPICREGAMEDMIMLLLVYLGCLFFYWQCHMTALSYGASARSCIHFTARRNRYPSCTPRHYLIGTTSC